MRLKISFMLMYVLCLSRYHVAAQEYHDRDSLWMEIDKAKADTNKVLLYIKIGQQYETNDPDSALILYELALKLSESLGYTRGMISYYTNATYVYNLKGMLDTALILNLRSVELARNFGNAERLAACLGNVAASYTMLDQPEKAIDIYLQIFPLFEKLAMNVNRGVIYENLCVLYYDIKQPEKAIEHGHKGLEIFRELKSDYRITGILNNLALAYTELGQYDKSIDLLKEAAIVARRTNNQYSLMVTSLNLSNVNIERGNLKVIKGYCDQALSLARTLNDPVSQAIALRGLAIHFFNADKPVEAEEHAEKSLRLALENHSIKNVGKAYSVLAEIAILKKDFEMNRYYSNKSDSIRNVLLNESIAKNIQNVEAKYESEKKEQKIMDLQQEAAIKDLSLERNKLYNAVLVGSLVSVLLIVLLAGLNYHQKKTILTQENRVHEARIAQLETEKQVLAGEAVMKGQEEERGRLAKDLHDGLGGMLSGVKFSLTNMKSHVILDAETTLVFERSLDMLDHSISELRRVAHNMMPEVLVRFGLSEALKSYCESLRTSNMFKIDYQSMGVGERLPEKTEIFIFRIVQELLNNVVKHAHASHVLVQLAKHDTEVNLTIEDNGMGFDATGDPLKTGAGLTSVRSRVDYLKGKLDIQSKPGEGTSIHITIPLS